MTLFDEKDAFLDALTRTRRWTGLGKADFHKALYGHGSDSTQDRLERGQTPSKTGTPDKRLQLARLVIDKTGCPPALFGLPDEEQVAELRDLQEDLQSIETRLETGLTGLRESQADLLSRLERLEHADEESGS